MLDSLIMLAVGFVVFPAVMLLMVVGFVALITRLPLKG
jgi:hypothetical protein